MFGPVRQFDTGAIFKSLDSFMRTHPEIAAAFVAALGALALVAYATIRSKRPMGTRSVETLEGVDEVAVPMHPNPGPDAMATAIGVACFVEQVGTTLTTQFAGQIRHQENRVFQTVLDFDLDPIDHVSDLAAEAVVLIDHNEPRGLAGAEGILSYTVVDHRPDDGVGEAFIDVRTDYGACSSIVAEHFHDVGVRSVPPDMHASEVNVSYIVPSQVATGLVYGIPTDTKHLTAGCSAADFGVAGFLFPGVNEDHLDRIANPEVFREVLEAKVRATAGHGVRGLFAVADIGTISNVDTISQVADELTQLEGVTAAVVCGEHESNVYLSGRSRDNRVHMGRMLEAVLDHYCGSSAGGHARMDGGQITRPDAAADGGNGESAPHDEFVEHIFEALSGDI